MSARVETGPRSPAIERAVELMEPEAAAEGRIVGGYLDLLGSQDPIGSSFFERAMRGKLIPLIYEPFWRPVSRCTFYGPRGPFPRGERRIALEMLELSPSDLVLDIGCGPGTFTRPFASAVDGGLAIGFDASETMLEIGLRRKVAANLAYVRGDACALPFVDARLDAVCCFAALHLVAEPMVALDEMTRVLVPGGRLGLMSTWSRRDRPPRRLTGVRVFGRDELTSALEARGYLDVEQRVSGWGQFVSARKPKG